MNNERYLMNLLQRKNGERATCSQFEIEHICSLRLKKTEKPKKGLAYNAREITH